MNNFNEMIEILNKNELKFLEIDNYVNVEGGVRYTGIMERVKNETNVFTEALSNNSSLETLWLRNFLSDKITYNIISALLFHPAITSLYIQFQLSEECLNIILKLFEKNKNISELHVTNLLSDKSINKFIEVFNFNSYLTELSIICDGMSQNSFDNFFKALKNNKILKRLTIQKGWVYYLIEINLLYLVDSLKQNNTLSFLKLILDIDDNDAKNLAEALELNTGISILHLNNNRIADIGAFAFSKMLQINKTLKVLYLNNNKIRKNGLKELAEGVKNNISLVTLSLESNDFNFYHGESIIYSKLQDTLEINKKNNKEISFLVFSLINLALNSQKKSVEGYKLKQMSKINKFKSFIIDEVLDYLELNRGSTMEGFRTYIKKPVKRTFHNLYENSVQKSQNSEYQNFQNQNLDNSNTKQLIFSSQNNGTGSNEFDQYVEQQHQILKDLQENSENVIQHGPENNENVIQHGPVNEPVNGTKQNGSVNKSV